jgi:hypothetical protein
VSKLVKVGSGRQSYLHPLVDELIPWAGPVREAAVFNLLGRK